MNAKEKSQATSPPKVFTFNPSNQPIRVGLINNEPYFSAKDVCVCLGLENSSQAISKLDEDEKGVIISDTPGGKQSLSAINESGLYNLIFQSRKPEAKIFRKWVTSEVLPSLRKTGSYSMRQRADCDCVDLRNVPYELRQVCNSQVRVINWFDIDWFSINDVLRAIGSGTESTQTARCLSKNSRTRTVKIHLFGNTHPAWFTTIGGVKLIISGSRKLRGNNPQQLQITIGGLV